MFIYTLHHSIQSIIITIITEHTCITLIIIIIKSKNIHVFTSSKTIQSSLYNSQQSSHNHVFKHVLYCHISSHKSTIYHPSNEQSIQIILILSHEISHEFHYTIKQDHHTNHV